MRFIAVLLFLAVGYVFICNLMPKKFDIEMDIFEIYIDSLNKVSIKNALGKTELISVGDIDNQIKCKIDIENQIIKYIKIQPPLKKIVGFTIIHENCGFLHRKLVMESLESCKGRIKQLFAYNPEIFVTDPLFFDHEKD